MNSSPNKKTLDLSKFKAFTDDNMNVIEKLKLVLGRVDNCGKNEKMLVTSIFFFSHHVFKSFFPSWLPAFSHLVFNPIKDKDLSF